TERILTERCSNRRPRQGGIARRQVISSRDLTETLLARIDAVNPAIDTVVELRGEEALREAAAARANTDAELTSSRTQKGDEQSRRARAGCARVRAVRADRRDQSGRLPL